MNGIGDKMIRKLRAVAQGGGWRRAGFDFGHNNKLYLLVEAGLVAYDGTDYVVTVKGLKVAQRQGRRPHRGRK